jgi:hypothetical protein
LLVLGACGSGGGTSAPPTGGTTPSTASLVEERSAAGRPETTLATRWARTLSGPSNEDEIECIAAAPDGGVYLTGKFERSTTVGTTTLGRRQRISWSPGRSGTVACSMAEPASDNFDIAADDRGRGQRHLHRHRRLRELHHECRRRRQSVVAFAWTEASAGHLAGRTGSGRLQRDLHRGRIQITSLDTDGGWTRRLARSRDALSDTLLLRP